MNGNGNLIDTNLIIKVINKDAIVTEIFDNLDDIYISFITLGELLFGASKSAKKDYNTKLFNNFVGDYKMLGISADIAAEYGEVKWELK